MTENNNCKSFCHISPDAPHADGKKHREHCDAIHTPYPSHKEEDRIL